MRTFTDMDGSKIRREALAFSITTTAYGIEVDRASLNSAAAHDEFTLAMALALDDLSKIRRGGTIKPRKTPPPRAEWPSLLHK